MAEQLLLPIAKSNLLARLIYGGQKLRAKPCPIHKGRWSGCVWGEQLCPEGCNDYANVTGWIPESDDHLALEGQDFPPSKTSEEAPTT